MGWREPRPDRSFLGRAQIHAKTLVREVMRQKRDGETDCGISHGGNARASIAKMLRESFLKFLHERSAIRIPATCINTT
jgi:hypothetical protein